MPKDKLAMYKILLLMMFIMSHGKACYYRCLPQTEKIPLAFPSPLIKLG